MPLGQLVLTQGGGSTGRSQTPFRQTVPDVHCKSSVHDRPQRFAPVMHV